MSRSLPPAPCVARVALAALAALLVACGRSSPARPAVAAPGPAASPRAAASPGAAARFAYAGAPTTYEVSTEGTVAVEGDSAAPLRVTTSTRVTLSLGAAEGDAPRPVRASVDAFAVPGARGVAAGARLPLALAGTLDARRHRATLALAAPQAADTACLAAPPAGAPNAPPPRPAPSTPALSLLATARDLLPTPPADLAPGARWEESVETVECRGLVPVTTRATYRYEARGPATFAGVTHAVRVTRTSESESRGERATGGRTVRVRGASRGTFDLFFNAAAGRYLGGAGQTEGTLEVDAGDGRVRRYTQRFTTRVGARGAAPR